MTVFPPVVLCGPEPVGLGLLVWQGDLRRMGCSLAGPGGVHRGVLFTV